MAGPSSVVLMSGGIESAALLCHWRSTSSALRLHPLYINYGQRGAAMEEEASVKICNTLGLHFSRIDMSAVGEQFRVLQKQARAFVPLPHRNLVILGLAASFATQVGSNEVALGLNKEDLGSYSSASQSFLESFRSTAASLQPPVTLLTPLSHLTKAEVIRLGKSLGVPLADTYSCMVGRPLRCGRCHRCRLRQLAFASASEQEPAGFYERCIILDSITSLSYNSLIKITRFTGSGCVRTNLLDKVLHSGLIDLRFKASVRDLLAKS